MILRIAVKACIMASQRSGLGNSPPSGEVRMCGTGRRGGCKNQRVTVWSAQFSDRGWAVGCYSARVSSGTISAGRMATAASDLGGAGGVWRQQHNEIASDRRKSKVFHLEHEEMGQRPAAFAMLF